MRAPQERRCARFALEAHEELSLLCELRLQDLDRERLSQANVIRLVHDAHASGAELAHEPVLPVEDGAGNGHAVDSHVERLPLSVRGMMKGCRHRGRRAEHRSDEAGTRANGHPWNVIELFTHWTHRSAAAPATAAGSAGIRGDPVRHADCNEPLA